MGNKITGGHVEKLDPTKFYAKYRINYTYNNGTEFHHSELCFTKDELLSLVEQNKKQGIILYNPFNKYYND
jgi:hypothetical protein